MSFVDPVSIAFLAVVRVVTHRRRQGSSSVKESTSRFERISVASEEPSRPLDGCAAQALEMLRPAVSERIVHLDSTGGLTGPCAVPLPHRQVAETALTRHSHANSLHHLIHVASVEMRLSPQSSGRPARSSSTASAPPAQREGSSRRGDPVREIDGAVRALAHGADALVQVARYRSSRTTRPSAIVSRTRAPASASR